MINDEWHRTHRLGPHAPLEDRITWHVAHAKVCGCRKMPARIAHEIARREKEAAAAAADRRES